MGGGGGQVCGWFVKKSLIHLHVLLTNIQLEQFGEHSAGDDHVEHRIVAIASLTFWLCRRIGIGPG